MEEKTIQFGNEGKELVPGKTENLSSALHQASHAAEVDAHLGGDGADVSEHDQFDRRTSELAADQQAHQDHGQGFIASDGETDTGAVPPLRKD